MSQDEARGDRNRRSKKALQQSLLPQSYGTDWSSEKIWQQSLVVVEQVEFTRNKALLTKLQLMYMGSNVLGQLLWNCEDNNVHVINDLRVC